MSYDREWAEAYLKQAEEDLKAAKILQLAAPSVFCMLMQMTFEKAAKAILLRKKELQLETAVKSHSAASRLIRILKEHRKFLPLTDNGKHYLWKDVLPIVVELERAQPSLAKKGMPILEYPWEDKQGNVLCPASSFPMNARLSGARTTAPRLLKFATLLLSDIKRFL